MIGRIGAVRCRACTWLFSSMQSTTAFSGGCRYSPTTARTLASSSGSVENLNVSIRQGCRFQSRQIRATVAKPTPSSPANSRLDQCVTPSRCGGGVNVATTTCASSTRRGRPDRGRSSSAALPGQQHDPGPLRQPGPNPRGPYPGAQRRLVLAPDFQASSTRHTALSQPGTVKSLLTRDTSTRG